MFFKYYEKKYALYIFIFFKNQIFPMFGFIGGSRNIRGLRGY